MEVVHSICTEIFTRTFTAKVYVFSDSVLCLGGKCTVSRFCLNLGTRQTQYFFFATPEYRVLDNLTGELFVFVWKSFPGHITKQLLQEMQNMIEIELWRPEDFQGRSMFMSMYNDTDSTAKDTLSMCGNNLSEVSAYAAKFPVGHWTFLGPGSGEKWYGTIAYKPEEAWDRTAEKMMLNFAEFGHPVFRGANKSFIKRCIEK